MSRTPEHNAKIGAALKARGVGQSPTKVCPVCERELPREIFGVRPKTGYTQSQCPDCRKQYNAAKSRKHWHARHAELSERRSAANRRVRFRLKYGITPERYEEMRVAQESACAICERVPEEGDKPLFVDHDHTTGEVRGLLCGTCNTAIGMLKDSPVLLRSAAGYLERHLTSKAYAPQGCAQAVDHTVGAD